MSVIINLKEFFASDSPEIIAEKLNYDFNQLLELGIGKKGQPGIQGLQGPIGPVGQTGAQGVRGNLWFTGNLTTPPTATSLGAMVGDFYLNTQDAWQLDSDGVTWNPVLNFGTIINNYLSVSTSTFIRNINGVSNSDQFITFVRSDHQFNDRISTGYSPLSFKNDILLLHNYNISSLGLVPDDFYTAMNSIYVNHVNGNVDNTVRHHIQFGVFYDPGSGVKATTENESYKIKYQIGNNNVFLARHTLAPIETASPGDYTFDSSMNWLLSKQTTSGGLSLNFNSIQSMTSLGSLMDSIDGISVENISGSNISKWALGIDTNSILKLQARDGVSGFRLMLEGNPHIVVSTTGSGKTNIGRSTTSGAVPTTANLGLNVLGSFGKNSIYVYPDNTQVNPGNSYTLTRNLDADDAFITFFHLPDTIVTASDPYVLPSSKTGYPFTQKISFPAADVGNLNRIVEIKNLNYNGLWKLKATFTNSGTSTAYAHPSENRSQLYLFGTKIQGQFPNVITEYEILPGETATFQCVRASGGFYAWITVNQAIKSEPWKQVLENGHTFPMYIPSSSIMVNGELVPLLSSIWNDPSTLSSTYEKLSVRKTFNNMVEVKGTAECNSSGSLGTVFTLPVGYRPAKQRFLSAFSSTDASFVPVIVGNSGGLIIGNYVPGLYHFEFRFEAEL